MKDRLTFLFIPFYFCYERLDEREMLIPLSCLHVILLIWEVLSVRAHRMTLGLVFGPQAVTFIYYKRGPLLFNCLQSKQMRQNYHPHYIGGTLWHRAIWSRTSVQQAGFQMAGSEAHPCNNLHSANQPDGCCCFRFIWHVKCLLLFTRTIVHCPVGILASLEYYALQT